MVLGDLLQISSKNMENYNSLACPHSNCMKITKILRDDCVHIMLLYKLAEYVPFVQLIILLISENTLSTSKMPGPTHCTEIEFKGMKRALFCGQMCLYDAHNSATCKMALYEHHIWQHFLSFCEWKFVPMFIDKRTSRRS